MQYQQTIGTSITPVMTIVGIYQHQRDPAGIAPSCPKHGASTDAAA
jgi:hypothetical protein